MKHLNSILKEYFVLLYFSICAIGCRNPGPDIYSKCYYRVTQDYIESNCQFDQSIYFEKVLIDSAGTDDIPVKYSTQEIYSVGRINLVDSSTNRIYFYHQTDNYNWYDIKNQSLSQILPITMEPNNWYLIRALMINGNPNGMAFIQVDSIGEYHFVYTSLKTAW